MEAETLFTPGINIIPVWSDHKWTALSACSDALEDLKCNVIQQLLDYLGLLVSSTNAILPKTDFNIR